MNSGIEDKRKSRYDSKLNIKVSFMKGRLFEKQQINKKYYEAEQMQQRSTFFTIKDKDDIDKSDLD